MFSAALSQIKLRILSTQARSISMAILAAGAFAASAAATFAENAANISALISNGQVQAAAQALERQAPTDLDRLFFQGRVLKASGKFAEAISVFRKVLAREPNYINARRELAHTLLLSNDFAAAEHHFNALMRMDSNAQMRAGYRDFLGTIHRNKPIGWVGHFALLPSTNINRGTQNTVLDTNIGQFRIDPNSKAESGVGAQMGLSGFIRQPVSPNQRVTLNWTLTGTRYPLAQYNSTQAGFGMGYEQLRPTGSWNIGTFYRKQYRAEDDSASFGLRYGVTHVIDSKTQFEISLSQENTRYAGQKYLNGNVAVTSFGLNRQLSPSFSVGTGVSVEKSVQDLAHTSYKGSNINLSINKAWKGGLQTNFGFESGARDFAGFFPFMNFPRYDVFEKFKLEFKNSQINIYGFAPRLSCNYTENKSNISIHAYDANECQITFSKMF